MFLHEATWRQLLVSCAVRGAALLVELKFRVKQFNLIWPLNLQLLQRPPEEKVLGVAGRWVCLTTEPNGIGQEPGSGGLWVKKYRSPKPGVG